MNVKKHKTICKSNLDFGYFILYIKFVTVFVGKKNTNQVQRQKSLYFAYQKKYN